MQIAKQSAHILYRNGDTHVVDGFDKVNVRERTSADQSELHEYGADVSGELEGSVLRIRDGSDSGSFAAQNVSYVTIERYTPARPFIVAGAAVAGALLFGFAAAAGGRSKDCSEYGDCVSSAAAVLGAGAIGMGIGLAVSIPITDLPLGTHTYAPRRKASRD